MKNNFSQNQRIAILIDVQNLYHSAKHLYHGRVNYGELIKYLRQGRQLIRTIAYVVKSDTSLGESQFFEALLKEGIELRMKDLQVYPDGTKKADWDIGMAVDAMRLSKSVDAIILVTGDGDFLPLVDYLKWGQGTIVEVAAFSKTTSAKLQEAADKFINLEDIPRIIIKKWV